MRAPFYHTYTVGQYTQKYRHTDIFWHIGDCAKSWKAAGGIVTDENGYILSEKDLNDVLISIDWAPRQEPKRSYNRY